MSALGDALRQLADLADAGVLTGRSAELSLHHDVEDDTRMLGAILRGEVREYESHTGTAQVSSHADLGGVRVVAMVRTDRPWVETAPEQDDDGTEAESLAEVQAPALPDALVHGRAGVA